MLTDIRKIKHQKQTRKLNCVSTCLSMVTNIDESFINSDIRMDGFKEPFSNEAALRFLCRKGIHMEIVNGTTSLGLMINRIYLLSCPSSTNPKMAHMVVGLAHSDGFQILDPADDLESEKIYSSTDFSEGNIPIFCYYLLTDCNYERI